jgi:PAS domain S-box-containing protein
MLKESFSFTPEVSKELSPSLSPRSSSPRSTASTRRLSASIPATIHPGDYPFPSMDSVSGSRSGSGDTRAQLFPRAGSSFSDATVRFRPEITPSASRRPTYNTWPAPQDFPSPNIYDLTLKMNADIGIDSFWENIIEIFVTNFYASRVTLSLPYDLTDINNTPWGLKATYKGSIDRQQTRIKLERRQSHEMNAIPLGNDSDADTGSISDNDTPTHEVPMPAGKSHRPANERRKSVEASIEEQLDQMLSADHVGKVYATLKPLNVEDEPLIDSTGVQRVLNRGAIVVLSREYHDLEEVKRREEERLKAHQDELKEESPTWQGAKKKSSIRSEVLAAWEKTFFKPPDRGQLLGYEEYEQPLASPWSQSPAPSPAILRESSDNPFFDRNEPVEAAFSPSEEPEYAYTDAVYAIGMENSRSIIHIPLVHPHTSKTISSESESSGSSGHSRIVPVAIISFCSAVAPYPAHLISSLSTFAPLIATSLSQAIRHSNVLHQLTYSPIQTPRNLRQPQEQTSRTDYRRTKHGRISSHESPVSHSSATNSDTSTPSWELQGHLFSPAVAQAEVPSPFRSTLSTETDYFSPRGGTVRAVDLTRSLSSQHREEAIYQTGPDSGTDDLRPESSSKSSSTAPTEQSKSPSDLKTASPIRVRKRAGRRVTRMVHSHGATSQLPGNIRTMPRKGKAMRSSGSFSDASDPYQMPTPSSRLLKVVVDSIPVHVFTASPGTGTITWANGRTLAYRGVTAEEYIENPHGSLHPDDSKEFLKRWNRMLHLETEGISQSVRIKRFDGQYRWFAARVVPLRDSRGGVVHWFGTNMDIHDAREAEIDTARQEEVKASEMKYRLFAEASPQIVFAASPSFGISYANSQWMSYSGVTYEETVKLGFLSFVHSDDRAKCALPAASDATHPQLTVEIRLQGADKSYRWYLVKCIRIEEHDDRNNDVWLGTWYRLPHLY